MAAHGLDRSRLAGIGVSISGSSLGPGKGFNTPFYLDEWAQIDLGKLFGARFGIPALADNDGNVVGVTAISNDGSHVWFVAQGVLAGNTGAQGATATSGANNFYVVNTATGAITFIGADKSTLCTISLAGVDIVSAEPQKFDATAENMHMVKVQVQVESMSFDYVDEATY